MRARLRELIRPSCGSSARRLRSFSSTGRLRRATQTCGAELHQLLRCSRCAWISPPAAGSWRPGAEVWMIGSRSPSVAAARRSTSRTCRGLDGPTGRSAPTSRRGSSHRAQCPGTPQYGCVITSSTITRSPVDAAVPQEPRPGPIETVAHERVALRKLGAAPMCKRRVARSAGHRASHRRHELLHRLGEIRQDLLEGDVARSSSTRERPLSSSSACRRRTRPVSKLSRTCSCPVGQGAPSSRCWQSSEKPTWRSSSLADSCEKSVRAAPVVEAGECSFWTRRPVFLPTPPGSMACGPTILGANQEPSSRKPSLGLQVLRIRLSPRLRPPRGRAARQSAYRSVSEASRRRGAGRKPHRASRCAAVRQP
jgi:hypothetical protein